MQNPPPSKELCSIIWHLVGLGLGLGLSQTIERWNNPAFMNLHTIRFYSWCTAPRLISVWKSLSELMFLNEVLRNLGNSIDKNPINKRFKINEYYKNSFFCPTLYSSSLLANLRKQSVSPLSTPIWLSTTIFLFLANYVMEGLLYILKQNECLFLRLPTGTGIIQRAHISDQTKKQIWRACHENSSVNG